MLLLHVLEPDCLSHSKLADDTSFAGQDRRSAEGFAGTLSPCPQDVYCIEISAGSQASVLKIKRSPRGMGRGPKSAHM